MEQAQNDFNKFLEDGNKLNDNEFKTLNSVWKNDYATHVGKQHKKINKII